MAGVEARQDLAARRVIRALTDDGPNPGYHRHQLERLGAEWPALARALSELVASHGIAPGRELTAPSTLLVGARTSWP